MSTILEKTIVVTNKRGIHNRPSVLIYKKAQELDAEIKIYKGEKVALATSVMQIMILAATCGTEIKLTTEGPEAEHAMETMSELLASDFGEAY